MLWSPSQRREVGRVGRVGHVLSSKISCPAVLLSKNFIYLCIVEHKRGARSLG